MRIIDKNGEMCKFQYNAQKKKTMKKTTCPCVFVVSVHIYEKKMLFTIYFPFLYYLAKVSKLPNVFKKAIQVLFKFHTFHIKYDQIL